MVRISLPGAAGSYNHRLPSLFFTAWLMRYKMDIMDNLSPDSATPLATRSLGIRQVTNLWRGAKRARGTL